MHSLTGVQVKMSCDFTITVYITKIGSRQNPLTNCPICKSCTNLQDEDEVAVFLPAPLVPPGPAALPGTAQGAQGQDSHSQDSKHHHRWSVTDWALWLTLADK